MAAHPLAIQIDPADFDVPGGTCFGQILSAAHPTCSFSVNFSFRPDEVGRAFRSTLTVAGPNAAPAKSEVTAIAVKNDAAVYVEVRGPGRGTVDASNVDRDCGRGPACSCSFSSRCTDEVCATPCVGFPYVRGSKVTLTARPALGSAVESWTGRDGVTLACAPGELTCTFTAPQTGDAPITVTFRKTQ